MIGSFKSAIGILVLIAIFLLVFVVLLCSFNSELPVCPYFQPFLALIDSLLMPR